MASRNSNETTTTEQTDTMRWIAIAIVLGMLTAGLM